jgi:PAS domain S-box-containing protein
MIKRVRPVFEDEKFLRLLEAAPDAMVIVDGRGDIVMLNSQFERLFGWTRSEAQTQPVEIFIPERYRNKHKMHRSDYAADPRVRPMGSELQLYGLRRDGREFPVEISLSPLELEEGTFIIAAIRDMTGRKTAEEKFRGLLEAAPDAMVVVDDQGMINLINSQMEKLFGYDRAEIVGKPIEVVVPKRLQRKHIHHRKGYMAEHPARPMGGGLDLFGVRKNGTEFPVEISLSPLKTEKGLLVSAAIRDITERKRTEADIQKLNHDLKQYAAQLEAANKELESFSYSVSHDLRAPLRGIDGFSQVLIEDYGDHLPPEARGYLDRVRASAQRMAGLIDDLINLARVTRTTPQFKLIDLSVIAEEIIKSLKEAHPDRRVTVSIEPEMRVSGDPSLMHIALENLLGNAWKFTSRRERAIIEFGQKQIKEQRTFHVRDNGAGFDMTYADRLFGAFQRLHSAGEFPGTGIGLATVHRIISIHGGHAWAEAEDGKGATFYFTL